MDHWLPRATAMHPDRVALRTPRATLTYAELLARASAAAGGLREQGVGAGDRVALALDSPDQLVVAVQGCFLLGAVAVPVDRRLGAGERAQRAAGARVLVQEPPSGQPIVPEPLRLEAIATVIHTSGTTATPRPVALSYSNWLSSALGSAVALGLDPAERWLCPLPLAHVGGLSIPIRSTVYGTTAIVHERFEVEAVAGELRDPQAAVTLVSLVPTMLARLLDAGLREPPALRWALLGGGPIPGGLLERAREAGVPVLPTYGMTEGCSQIATGGWPLVGVELRIAPDGEVLVRGPTVAAGSLAADGWLHTGDLGALDRAGRLMVTSRKADTIITGGENVAPAEVEAVLLAHPGVADAAVFGRPDPDWGEALVASVVLRDQAGVDGEQLRAHCAQRLAGFKVPKAIEFVQRLPRSETGKLLRRELR